MSYPKSNFTYTKFGSVMAITDQDLGGITVTSDIENVVEYVCATDRTEPDKWVWIYRDSEGRWDGFDPRSDSFYSIGCYSVTDALKSDEVVNRLNWLGGSHAV